MSQVTTKDKISKCSDKLDLSLESRRFLNVLVEDSSNTIIDGYSLSISYYINNYFYDDYSVYYNSLKELIEKRFIYYNSDQDKMIILVQQPHHLNNILYGFKSIRKKKHIRKPIDQQQGLFSVLGELLNNALKKSSQVLGATKHNDKGFKVYKSLMPYFTGEQLKEEERELLNKYNPEMVLLEDNRRNMPKHSKLALCACLSFMDNNGIISDCTEYSLLQNVNDVFGKDTFCIQTWYNSIDYLLKVKIIEKFDDDDGCSCIRVCIPNFKDRYVIVPFVVFEKDFKKIENAGIKIFFDIIFGLNNGESINNDGTISMLKQDKAYFFKMAKLDTEKDENRDKFQKKLLQYKKRYPNEIRSAMFGDIAKWSRGEPKDENIKEYEFKALTKYFNFQYVHGTALMIYINKDYYISKESKTTEKKLATQVRHRRKMQLLDKLLKDHKIDYQDKDMEDLISVFRRENKRTISLIINIIADRIRRSSDLGWDKIKSLGAYARRILKEYKIENVEKIDYMFEG